MDRPLPLSSTLGPAKRRLRRRAFSAATACVVIAVIWLWATRGPVPSEGRNFFGAWRTLPLLVALALLWLAIALALTSRRRALFSWLLGTGLCVATLSLLEVSAFAGVADWARIMRNRADAPLGAAATPHVEIAGETLPDIAAAWNLPAQPTPFSFRTDRRGFRNHADRDEADVYLLGDSVLVAGMLPFEETIAARLEAELRRPVLNIALIGIGAARQHELLVQSGLPLRNRTVLQFVTEANDLEDSRRERAVAPEPAPGLAAQSFTNNAVLWLQRLLQPVPYEAHWRRGTIDGTEYLFHWIERDTPALRGEVEPVLAQLGDTRAHVVAAGGRYAVVLMPSKYRVLHALCRWPEESPLRQPSPHLSPLADAIRSWASEGGCPLIDLTEPMQQSARAGAIPYFAADTHPNAIGHALAANAVLRWWRSATSSK